MKAKDPTTLQYAKQIAVDALVKGATHIFRPCSPTMEKAERR